MHPKVMVVEDEEALSELLRYNLESEGFEVEVQSRGDDAELRLRETVPDLLLLDWMLPGLSGIELCRRIRLRDETENLPIIMLTARSEESERVRGLSTGADDFVVKPFSVPELMARVKAMLRRSSPQKISSLLTAGDIELDRETLFAQFRDRGLQFRDRGVDTYEPILDFGQGSGQYAPELDIALKESLTRFQTIMRILGLIEVDPC